ILRRRVCRPLPAHPHPVRPCLQRVSLEIRRQVQSRTFFLGSFDLAVTRFSGRAAPQKDGVDRVTREAYSHEVTSCGFWPGDRRFKEASFYAYSAPSPPGLDAEPVRPAAAHWDRQLGEFILKYS